MANVFSFYQYDATGINGESLPTTAPYFNSFTGFYIPPSVLAGNKVGFLWQIYDEYTLRPPKLRIKMSGEVGNTTNDSFAAALVMSGNLSTLVTDSGIFFFNYSGEVPTGMQDGAFFRTVYSGSFPKNLTEIPTFSIYPSGSYSIVCNETSSFSTVLTGEMMSNVNEISWFSTLFSGTVNKKDKDYLNLNYSLSGISYTMGARKVIITGDTDTMSHDLSLRQVIYDFIG